MSSRISVELVLIDKLSHSFAEVEGKFARFANKLSSSLSSMINLPNIVGGYLAKSGMDALLDATIKMQSLQFRLKAATGDSAIFGDAMNFVITQSNRMGLSIEQTGDSFAGFSAAALRSGLNWGQVKDIFVNVGEAMVSLHIPMERQKLVFLALEQMASKNKISSEELRRQLAESLPGAFAIAAKSIGVTTSKLNDMLMKGQLMADEFLPRFTRAIREDLGGAFTEASAGLQANLLRASNAWFLFKSKLGESLIPVFNQVLSGTTGFLDSLKSAIPFITGFVTSVVAQVVTIKESVGMMIDEISTDIDLIVTELMAYVNMFTGFVRMAFGEAAGIAKAVGKALSGNFSGALEELDKMADESVKNFSKVFDNADLDTLKKQYGILINDSLDTTNKRIDKITKAWADVGTNTYKAKDALEQYKAKAVDSNYGLTPSAPPAGVDLGGEASFSLTRLTHAYNTIDKMLPAIQNVKDASFEMWAALSGIGTEGYLKMKEQLASIPEAADKSLRTASIHLASNFEKMRDAATGVKAVWYDFAAGLESRFKSMYDTLTDLNMSWADKGKSIVHGFYRMSTDLLWDYIKEYIAVQLIGSASHTATSTKEKAENISTAYTNAADTAIEGGKGVAKTPYVGAILAVAAAAAVFGYLETMINRAKSADIGTPYSPEGFYKLHANEYMNLPRGTRVLSAPDSRRLDYQAASAGSQTTAVNITVNNPSSNFINDLQRMIRNGQADGFLSDLRVAMARY